MLKISDLSVSVGKKLIIDNLNLEIAKGKKVAVMGPNGSGKSTLSNIIAGKPGYNVIKGSVTFEGESILDYSPNDRAAMGIYLAFQYPIEIPGIANSSFLRTAINSVRKKNNEEPVNTRKFLEEIESIAKKLDLDKSFLSRDMNCGFSGGEKKKNEILQMSILNPKLSILDETDSGLDIDALKIVANGVNSLRKKNNSFLIITHYQRLLDYIKPDYVHVLMNGQIIKSGGPELALELEKKGYENFN